MSSPTLKNMDYKQESWFHVKFRQDVLTDFKGPMAAILDFSDFLGQI